MKKFCNKITNHEWRGLTVPNLRKIPSPSSVISDITTKSKSKRSSSGSYDVEYAQQHYDQTHSLPNCVYINDDIDDGSSNIIISDDSNGSDDDDDSNENYEDAINDKTFLSHQGNNEIVSDSELYIDIDATTIAHQPPSSITVIEEQYDVPRISFSFFDKRRQQQQFEDDDHHQTISKTPPVTMKSEVKIMLKAEDTSVVQEQQQQMMTACQSLEVLPLVGLIRCGAGSDPTNIHQPPSSSSDNLYKVPRQLTTKGCRLSQSLTDFDVIDAIDTIALASNHSSIDHVSCSQVIVPSIIQDSKLNNSSTDMDYCKVRSRLPLKIRRPTFLRKPKTWNNFKSKFNNLISEQAAQQGVGAYGDCEKISLNFEEMYKNSKNKCRRAALKMFGGAKNGRDNNSSSMEDGSDGSSQIVKNDAFFARVADIKAIDNDDSIVNNNKGDDLVVPNNSNVSGGSCGDDEKKDFDFATIKSAFRKSKFLASVEGQNGFEDLRRYVKQGGDFCKELSTILQERADAETHYAKSLSKLSGKLTRACRDGVGGLNEAWKTVAADLEARSEVHRVMGAALLDETARPLRTLTESQHRSRKQCETAVDKAMRLLGDWRAAEAKGKKQSHTCARDNEKLQDAAALDTSRNGKLTLSRSTSLIQLAHMHNKTSSDKETAKMEGKKRKAEDAVKKADIEYYTLCVRAERARLEWESAVLRGVNTFQQLEEERLTNLKSVLSTYLQHETELGPRLVDATERLRVPVADAEPTKDLTTFVNLRQSSQQVSEQLLPDFYCEHITLAMNRERRKQALVKLLHLIRQDIERERKSKNGLENLSKAIKQTPNFGAEDSQQSVSEKLYHMKSMLTYLEGARFKVQNALAELDSRPKSGHPLAQHITITRDKSGLQQSVLKVPQWLREDWFEPDKSPLSEKSLKSDNSDPHNNDLPCDDWTTVVVDDDDGGGRGAADGNSNQPDSDFDEFSSECSSSGNICGVDNETPVMNPIAQCRALYAYTPNLTDELPLRPGDILSVYRQQDDGWWLGECGGSVGIFPATYVEIVP